MKKEIRPLLLALLGGLCAAHSPVWSANSASEATKASNQSVLKELDFSDQRSFELAKKGFIATLESLKIPGPNNTLSYDGSAFEFLNKGAPDTVNPSLWRQSQLNALHTGLYEVQEGIYQVRGLDLANMTVIRGEKGWIVIDPLTSAETAAAALALVNKHLGERPVTAVLITHSHADHFAGLPGVVTTKQVMSGEVALVAPAHLVAEAISENVVAGNVMVRRASYMFGKLLPTGETGFVSSGLGTTFSSGTTGLLPPNKPISNDITEITLDGVELIVQNAPGAEAPEEIVFYLPKFRALHMAEITSQQLHNVYTLRGAKIRDARLWSKHINKALTLFGEKSDTLLASHHWPIWGNADLTEYLEKQRDMYKFIHDQTLRLANQGYNMVEIANKVKLPDALGKEFYNRGYYGTVSHNVRAVYTSYLGYFDGNPSNLDPLPPVEAGKRYVSFMGGADAVLEKAKASYQEGDYRWVATVLNHLVFAEPENAEAKGLLADTLEQLGYQAESGPWRNFYLTGAQELREGVSPKPLLDRRKMFAGASLDMVFNALAVRLNPDKAAGKHLKVNLNFTDINSDWLLEVRHSVLHGLADRRDDDAPVTLSLSSRDFKLMIAGLFTPAKLIESGALKVAGDMKAWAEVGALMDQFDPWFSIVTPRP